MIMKVLVVDQILSVNYKYTFGLVNNINSYNNIEVEVIGDYKENMSECMTKYSLVFNTADNTKNKIQKTVNYFKSWSFILNKCVNEKIDILHTQWFILSPMDYYFINKIKKLGVKIVITVHDILPFNEKFYDYNYHKKLYDLADNIIVQADINKKRICEIFEGISNKVSCIPHGNFIDYMESCSKEEGKKYLNLDENKKIILFFGQIKKVKGLDVLIKAFNELISERNDLMLLIAGKVWGDDFDNYDKLIREYKLENNIRCDIKYIPDEDIKYYYGAADINVLPYLNVYQSGVVQLAYAYEKAVVATRVGAFPEVVIDGVTGALVEPNNYIELAKSIGNIIDDEDLLVSMGKEGKKFVEENLSWKVISEKVEYIYKNV